MKKKTEAQLLKEKLCYKRESVFEKYDIKQKATINQFAKEYADYLSVSKTEREAVDASIKILNANGFVEYKLGDTLKKEGKYYLNNRGKALYVFTLGKENVENGVRISAAHIDSPRLDLKQHPIYEDNKIAYFKTHYYGGIRKYQWPTIPLALHGVVVKANGEKINVTIGEDDNDPVFCISDLLPHLSKDQNQKPLAQAFPGENLNVIVGTQPYESKDDEKIDDAVKLNILNLLYEKYGIVEADLLSSELCFVPAGKTREVGFDRALLGGYGHDDVVCAYSALRAIIDNKDSVHSLLCILADKEEIGSEGVTSMQSYVFVDLLSEISKAYKANLAVVKANSICVSADVTPAYDPNYSDAFDSKNISYLNEGIAMAKYTGAGGKSSTNDASAEVVWKVRKIFDDNNVIWQTSEIGKVDQGGGGTVAKYIAKINIDTVDIGVPVLSMHAPFEIISKGDLYSAYEAFSAICK